MADPLTHFYAAYKEGKQNVVCVHKFSWKEQKSPTHVCNTYSILRKNCNYSKIQNGEFGYIAKLKLAVFCKVLYSRSK